LGAVTLNGGQFEKNRSTLNAGGGLYANTTLTLTATQFLSNTANSQGGGAYAGGAVTLTNGLFQNNRSTTDSGGGVYVFGTVWLTGTQFISNSASIIGGGAVAQGAATLTNPLFRNNQSTTDRGGGLYTLASLTLTGGEFSNNASPVSGGGLYASNAFVLNGTQFLNNTASVSGGGLYHSTGDGRVVNALFARNASPSGVDLGLFSSGNVQVLHTTIASPTLTSGSAIFINSGIVGITNTIVTSHTVGINRAAGTVNEDYNLFFGNTTDKNGTISGGTHDIAGSNPSFVNPALDNYHINVGSPAIDTGTNAGVTTDIDGQSRPSGLGFDIGYDEYAVIRKLLLPLILK
jgi:predicted outer membrane repeat protein